MPKMGVAFFDVPVLIRSKDWGITSQVSFGTSFAQAINYRWWWLFETSFGLGAMNVSHKPYLSSLMSGAGVRYNFLEGDVRPNVGLMLHYLQFLGQNVNLMPLNAGWPIWVGLRPSLGLEWFFYDEMALVVEGAYGCYVNINEPFRHVLYTSAAFALYF